MRVPGRLSVDEMRMLTEEYGVEFSLVYRTGPNANGGGGYYELYSGTKSGVSVPIGNDVRWIYHTHPNPSEGYQINASPADMKILKSFNDIGNPQKVSKIITSGETQVIEFTKDIKKK